MKPGEANPCTKPNRSNEIKAKSKEPNKKLGKKHRARNQIGQTKKFIISECPSENCLLS